MHKNLLKHHRVHVVIRSRYRVPAHYYCLSPADRQTWAGLWHPLHTLPPRAKEMVLLPNTVSVCVHRTQGSAADLPHVSESRMRLTIFWTVLKLLPKIKGHCRRSSKHTSKLFLGLFLKYDMHINKIIFTCIQVTEVSYNQIAIHQFIQLVFALIMSI